MFGIFSCFQSPGTTTSKQRCSLQPPAPNGQNKRSQTLGWSPLSSGMTRKPPRRLAEICSPQRTKIKTTKGEYIYIYIYMHPDTYIYICICIYKYRAPGLTPSSHSIFVAGMCWQPATGCRLTEPRRSWCCCTCPSHCSTWSKLASRRQGAKAPPRLARRERGGWSFPRNYLALSHPVPWLLSF